MTNSAQQLIQLAAMLIEDSNDVGAAESALRDAINVATVAGRALELIQAKTFLAELLLQSGREDESRELFEEVLTHANDPSIDESTVDYEVRRAREVIGGDAPDPKRVTS